MQPVDAGVSIVMDRLNDRQAGRFRHPDHCRADQGKDVVQVNDIWMLSLQYCFESPHARRRVERAERCVAHCDRAAGGY